MVAKSLQRGGSQGVEPRHVHPSPPAWEDQVFYFLIWAAFPMAASRISAATMKRAEWAAGLRRARFQPGDAGNAIQSEADAALARGPAPAGPEVT